MPLKPVLFSVTLFLLLSTTSCRNVYYVGDRYPSTNQVDVYYAERDVKREYKVIGHLSEQIRSRNGEERTKAAIVAKAREIGAHGIIITGIEHIGGEETRRFQKAEAILYTE